jgi:hypothetical protein
MGSAAVIPPPSAGFRRLYYLTSAEYAVSNIVLSRLKVARFSSLNDPFELLAQTASNRRVHGDLLSRKRSMDNGAGLLCFSEDWTDPVLWYQYGAKHTGICLGFDLAEGAARKINYQNDRLRDEDLQKKTDDEVLDLLLYTKFQSWDYEREWRVPVGLTQAVGEGPLHFIQFRNDFKLAEVVLGAECTLSLTAIRKLLSIHHPQVASFGARLALKSFAIVPNEATIVALPDR